GERRVDRTIRLDVVALGDDRRAVSEERGCRVCPDAAGDHRCPGSPIPAQTDSAAAQVSELEKLAESTADVVRAEGSSVATAEDGPSASIARHVSDPASQHNGGELRHGNASDRGVGLRPRLALYSA